MWRNAWWDWLIKSIRGTMRLLSISFIAIFLATDLGALTIYRIGGAGQTLPEIAGEAGVEFIQLEWADVDEDLHGSTDLMRIAPESIAPQQLDPAINLTPLLLRRDYLGEILYLTWIGWGGPDDDDWFIWDEDPNTVYLGDGHFAQHGPRHKSLIFDFGGLFFIERIKFYPRETHLHDRFVESFQIGTSDGDPLKDPDRQLQAGSRGDYVAFDVVHDVRENTNPVIELSLPDEPVRKVLFRAPENTRGIWELAELELYGAGFAPFAGYRSNVIDLGRAVSLGDLNWSGAVDPGARVQLTMRAGDTPTPNIYWRFTFRGDEQSRFDNRGRALTRGAYIKLNKGEKAGITPDTQSWESWSQAYDFAAGAGPMQSDKPRRYVQVRADFESLKDVGSRLDYVQFSVSDPPVATRVLAEIAPPLVRAGEVNDFTYALLPQFEENDLGFDTIEIETPVQAQSIDAVRISGQNVGFEILRSDDSGFTLSIPRIDLQRTDELVEVDFAVEVFKFGTVFTGRVSDSEKPFEVRQAVTPGDADPLADSNTLSVGLVEVEDKAVNALKLASSVLTPNGDGVNDALAIEYELLNLFGSVPVVLDLYDLSGNWVGSVYRGTAASGRFTLAWDGRLGDGSTPAPGMYLLCLEVDSDRGKEALQRVIALAY
jgi:hypothetical protein